MIRFVEFLVTFFNVKVFFFKTILNKKILFDKISYITYQIRKIEKSLKTDYTNWTKNKKKIKYDNDIKLI